ncbi:hypothetical protein C8A00DRAFT_44984 [Chaetomidium leptoderma]|uniref:Uncharacterized protein n=1 Tax=Chaetomidium leptoderma TaxID=669021 RepID=A0AAN6VIH6_9PEZI|nr:hypothetical protein C8A00DRAFT_44984 [Chaetomidium leptoderma]
MEAVRQAVFAITSTLSIIFTPAMTTTGLDKGFFTAENDGRMLKFSQVSADSLTGRPLCKMIKAYGDMLPTPPRSPHRDANTNNVSVHRLVQSEFRYNIRDTLQQAFEDTSMLLYHAFPQQVFGRTFRPDFPKCATLIQHVYSLRDHAEHKATARNHPQQGGLAPCKSFCRLMCNAAYYLVETGAAKELAKTVDVTTAALRSTGLMDEETLAYAHFCNSAGLEREMSGDFAAAKELLERARDIRCRELPPDHEDIGGVTSNLGNLNLSLGNYSEALRYHLICQDTVSREVQDNVRMNWKNLGRCCTAVGRYDEAMGALNKGKDSDSDAEPRFRDYYYWVGNVYIAQDNLDAAKAMYIKGREGLRAVGEAISANMAVCQNRFRETIAMMEFCKVADCEVARASYMLSVALRQKTGAESEGAVWLEKAEHVRMRMQGPGYKVEARGEAVYDSLVESWVR